MNHNDFATITPPHNLEAEQALLGALLVNNDVFETCYDFLRPDHFFNDLHQDIYKACLNDYTNNKTFTPITLKGRFLDYPGAEAVGGAKYLSKLAASAITIINAVDYARLIFELHDRRQAIMIAQKLITAAAIDDGSPINKTLEAIGEQLHDISAGNSPGDIAEHVAVSSGLALSEISKAMKSDDKVVGVKSGLIGLDFNIGGFRGGDLIIGGGRPGMGKTAVALNIAKGAAKNENNTLLFSLEMRSQDLSTRLITDAHFKPGVNNEIFYSDARNGRLSMPEYADLSRAAERVNTLPLYITDIANRTVDSVRLECIRHNRALEKRGQRLDFVVIDYLQLLTAGTTYRGQRVNEISEISRSLKLLAKELDVPVLVLSQLSRNLESRDNKRPILSDLRDSGAIEQDADIIFFVYREIYYLEKLEPTDAAAVADWKIECDRLRNRLELIIAKQRAGPPRTIYLDAYLGSNAIRDGNNNKRNGVLENATI